MTHNDHGVWVPGTQKEENYFNLRYTYVLISQTQIV